MALPPLNAATEDMPQPDPGADAPQDGGDNQPVVFATIMKLPDGKFLLVDGDEPEMGDDEAAMADKAGVDGPALLKQLMAKMEGGDDAQSAMEEGYAQGSDAAAPPMSPPPRAA